MEDDEKGKYRAPIDRYKDVDLPPPAVGPGATPMMGPIGEAPAVPAATPENFICLRGPCRHYWQRATFMASGNPSSTWDPEVGLKDDQGNPIQMPRQIDRTCLAHNGTETDLTEDNVFECTRWDPMSPRELRARQRRIAAYLRNAKRATARNLFTRFFNRKEA